VVLLRRNRHGRFGSWVLPYLPNCPWRWFGLPQPQVWTAPGRPPMEYFHHWGTGALAVSALLPFPFPTSAFFAIAGVLDYPLRMFLMIVTLARALRYGAIAIIASRYGRRFVVGMRHPGRHPGWVLAMAATAVIVTAVVILLARRMQSSGPEVSTDGNGTRGTGHGIRGSGFGNWG